MKKSVKLFALLLAAVMLLTVAGCGGGGEESQPAESQTAQESKNESTAPAESEPESTEPVPEYRNICASFLPAFPNLNPEDMWTMYDWDLEGQYVKCDHSLECAWGGGYGKAYLFDGEKSSDQTMFDDVGAYLSCNVKPGWGEFSGEIDENTVTWKKKDLNETLIIDLQGIFTIDKVNFSTLYSQSDHGMPAAFTIEISADGETWTVVVNEENYLQDITSKDQSFPFEAAEARFVRFHFTKGTKSIDPNLAYCVGLTEIEVWGR